jgi:quercetin dioxygenase-like cupin family protein
VSGVRVVRADEIGAKRGPIDAISKVFLDEENGPRNMSLGWMRIPVGGKTDRHTRDVEEIIYLLKGRTKVVLEGEEAVLEPGDSLFIPAGVEHHHESIGDEEMEHLFIFSPQGPERGIRGLPDAG